MKNYGKKLHKLVAKGQVKVKALSMLREYSQIPHARWIPIESFEKAGIGYLTIRQARTIEMWASRKIKGSVKLVKIEN